MISALPNTHAVLLRNRHLVSGRLAILGVSAPELLMELLTEQPEGAVAVTEHAGVLERLKQVSGWQCVYGYSGDGLKPGWAETVVVFVPKSRQELTMRLALAASLLAASGRVLLIGEKREGIAGAVKQLKLMAPDAVKVDNARHCQVWQAAPVEVGLHFDESRWLDWHTVEVMGVAVTVAGLPGIFSDGHLDEGTRILLETLDETTPKGPVLDFACGAGVIGAWLHARWGVTVDGVDVQAQAVACARQTYERGGVSGRITPSDGLEQVTQRYQTIVTNPPFHTGVKTDTSMTSQFLRQAAQHLTAGGELRLVANSFLPYAQLIKEHIGACRVLRQEGGFTVYSAIRH